MKRLTFMITCLLALSVAMAQNREADSLMNLLQKKMHDSVKVDILLQLSKLHTSSSPSEAVAFATQAIEAARKINYRSGLAFAYKNLGMVYYNQTKYVETIEYWNYAFALFDSTADLNNAALMLNNIGSVYMNQGDDAKALDYYFRCLNIAEKIGDKHKIAIAMGNIGTIYSNNRSTYDRALEYYLKALPVSEALAEKNVMGGILVNIGEIYLNRNELDSSLFYFKKSLIAYENTENIPYSLNDIGKTYTRKGNYALANAYHQQALNFSRKFDLQLDIVQSYLGLAENFYQQKKYNDALLAYQHAGNIAESINLKKELKDTYLGMALTYASMKDFGKAFRYQTLYTNIKDTLINQDIAQKISNLQTNFEIQKKQGQIDLLTKDKELQDLDIRRQKFAKNAFLIGFAMILALAFILYRNYRRKVAVNRLLDKQNAEIQHLILNILPAEVADELQRNGHATPRYFDNVSVLFSDFVGFTKIADTLSPQQVVAELNDCFRAFDEIVESHHLEKIKTIGDSYMCAGGIRRKDDSGGPHVVEMISAAMKMRDYMRGINEKRRDAGAAPWEIRIGIHTGPVVAGVVGKNKYAYDIWGSTVNVASRMESNGNAGQINVSANVHDQVKEYFDCTYRGKIFAKNVGEIDMYFVYERINVIAVQPGAIEFEESDLVKREA